ncbi:hypothetical protein VTK73DRAFT_5414 [Phialemonium thermophilum]|uniref:Uncharacterized protein n=1 Tax=Phialemonium thermophilum TaxID=223376 RepID=A0ABR3V3B9_9PEZI
MPPPQRLRAEAHAPQDVEPLGVGAQVRVHGLAGHVLAGGDAKLAAHGEVAEVEGAGEVVGAERRVEALAGPDAARRGLGVEEHDVGGRVVLEEGLGGAEARGAGADDEDVDHGGAAASRL